MSALKLDNLLPHLLLIVIGLFPYSIESFRFELRPGHTKCITEQLTNNSMTLGRYSLINHDESQPLHDSHKITVRVTSGDKHNFHYANRVASGNFAFVAPVSGDYMTCIWASDHLLSTNLTIDFEWKTGVPLDRRIKLVQKNHVDKMEEQLMNMHLTISSIHNEMFYLRLRETTALEHNGDLNDTMFWLSLLSLFLCLSVVGLQVQYLKAFFLKKKVI